MTRDHVAFVACRSAAMDIIGARRILIPCGARSVYKRVATIQGNEDVPGTNGILTAAPIGEARPIQDGTVANRTRSSSSEPFFGRLVRPHQMIPNKVCPVVFRRAKPVVEVLAFEHPLAGFQLVKGTIEPGESIEAAALRELSEESGIDAASVTRHLGIWPSGFEGQVWALVECEPGRACPDSWVHRAPDDGGHAFRFFWHPLFRSTHSNRWHSLFQGALAFIRDAA